MSLLVVGIAGATCSGKTTLSKTLHESFKDSILIVQDKYFLQPNDPRHTLVPELNHFNWEILSSLDLEKMYSDVLKIIDSFGEKSQKNCDPAKTSLLILEGFLIFNYKPISDLCNLKYFLTLTKETCWNRRKVREYIPPDVPGYFDKIVWPEYTKHQTEITNNKDLAKTITFFDESWSQEEMHTKICDEIKSQLG